MFALGQAEAPPGWWSPIDRFWWYWNRLKRKLADVKALPAKIQTSINEAAALQRRAIARGDTATRQRLKDILQALLAQKVAAAENARRVEEWLPKWLQIEQEQPKGLGDVGAIPIPIVIAAAAVIAIVWVKYINIEAEYTTQKELLSSIQRMEGLSPQEKAKAIQEAIKATKGPAFAEVTAGMGGLMMPLLFVGGGLAILYFFGAPQRRAA